MRTIITTKSDTKQAIYKNCTEADIKSDGIVWCNVGHTHCMLLQCTEKSNTINVKIIK